jgi:predicted kinase
LPQSGYTMAVTEQVFAALRDQAGQALRAGQSVVVDAVHRNPAERDMIAAVARRAGARFVGLWLDAPVDVLTARVEQRTGDASDATVGVVERQAQTDIGPLAWVRIDASQNPAAVVKAAIAACETARDIPD